jgi:hypothetical protein
MASSRKWKAQRERQRVNAREAIAAATLRRAQEQKQAVASRSRRQPAVDHAFGTPQTSTLRVKRIWPWSEDLY